MKVFECLKWENSPFKGPVMGIEIEVEGVDLPKEVPSWKFTKDGSLRGESGEYILENPSSYSECRVSIERLKQQFKHNNTVTNFSSRTSVHVHLNVADIEFTHLCNIVFLYFIVEDVLLKFCGEERYTNRFCLSVRSAEGIIEGIKARFDPVNIRTFSMERFKYAALNLASIPGKGSLEFRGMRGTLDTAVLHAWMRVIQNIYSTAAVYNSPQEIAEDVENVISQVFKNIKGVFNPNIDDIYYNMSICAELISSLSKEYIKTKNKKEACVPLNKAFNHAHLGVFEDLPVEARQVVNEVLEQYDAREVVL